MVAFTTMTFSHKVLNPDYGRDPDESVPPMLVMVQACSLKKHKDEYIKSRKTK